MIAILVVSLLTLVVLIGIPLGSALFKLYRDIVFAFDAASDGGKVVTKKELEGFKADINVIAKLFMKFSGLLVRVWRIVFK